MKKIKIFFITALFFSNILLADDQKSFELIDPKQPLKAFIVTTDKLKKPQVIRANFTQAKYLRVLKKPFLSSGRLLFVREDGVYWEINQPLNNAYIINRHGIKSVLAQSNSMTPPSSPISESISRMFSSIIGGDIETLGDAFDIYFATQKKAWEIKLQPKDKLISKVLSSIYLNGKLSGEGHINGIKIIENSGDYTKLNFSNVSSGQMELTEIETGYFSD